MFNTEFFFPGYLLFSLEEKFVTGHLFYNPYPIPSMHIGKLPIEVPYSFLARPGFGYIASNTGRSSQAYQSIGVDRYF